MLHRHGSGAISNLIGRWNVEITFGDGNKRSLHFDAQGEGKDLLRWSIHERRSGSRHAF
ncbi:MAG: hypothetical protein Udaeo2_08970 [Candidatus Udaeobacter sp.]|nr:MAG: hypothetical protein Udaeo2_08970 [Candidatus Udaeobacter sp.]